jgi:hypothetical protein
VRTAVGSAPRSGRRRPWLGSPRHAPRSARRAGARAVRRWPMEDGRCTVAPELPGPCDQPARCPNADRQIRLLASSVFGEARFLMRFSQRRATLRSRRGSPATFRDGALCGIALDVSRLRRSPSRGLLPRRMPSAFIDPLLGAYFHVAGGGSSSSIPWSAPSFAARSLALEVDPLLDAYFHVAGGGASSSIPWSAPSSAMGSGAPGLDPLLGASFHVAGDGASSSIPWSAPSSAARSRALEVDPLLAASFHVAGGRASSSIPWSAPSSAMGAAPPSTIPFAQPPSTSQEAAPLRRSLSRCPPPRRRRPRRPIDPLLDALLFLTKGRRSLSMRPMADFFVAIPNIALHADGGSLPPPRVSAAFDMQRRAHRGGA